MANPILVVQVLLRAEQKVPDECAQREPVPLKRSLLVVLEQQDLEQELEHY